MRSGIRVLTMTSAYLRTRVNSLKGAYTQRTAHRPRHVALVARATALRGDGFQRDGGAAPDHEHAAALGDVDLPPPRYRRQPMSRTSLPHGAASFRPQRG